MSETVLVIADPLPATKFATHTYTKNPFSSERKSEKVTEMVFLINSTNENESKMAEYSTKTLK